MARGNYNFAGMSNEQLAKVPISAAIPKDMDDRIERWRESLPAQTSKSAALRAIIEAGLNALSPIMVGHTRPRR